MGSAEEELRSRDASVRRAAIERAVRDHGVERLLPLLEDPDARVRHEGLLALGRLDDPRSLDAVIRRLEDPDRTVQDTAGELVARIGGPRALGPMIDACLAHRLDGHRNDPLAIDEESRRARAKVTALEALARRGLSGAGPADLLRLATLDDRLLQGRVDYDTPGYGDGADDYEVRLDFSAVRALAEVEARRRGLGAELEAERERRSEAAARRLREDQRRAALAADPFRAGSLDECRAELRRLLEAPRLAPLAKLRECLQSAGARAVDVRSELAASDLGPLIDLLVRELASPIGRSSALDLLALLPGEKVTAALWGLLRDARTDAEVRVRVAPAVAARDPAGLAGFVIALLAAEPGSSLCEAAVSALPVDDAIVGQIAGLLGSPRWATRKRAIEYLGAARTPAALRALRARQGVETNMELLACLGRALG